MVKTLKDVNTKKACGSFGVSQDLIAASGDGEIRVMVELCQRVLDFLVPDEWAVSIEAPTFKMKGDIHNCSFYRAMRLREHCMKVGETVLKIAL